MIRNCPICKSTADYIYDFDNENYRLSIHIGCPTCAKPITEPVFVFIPADTASRVSDAQKYLQRSENVDIIT